MHNPAIPLGIAEMDEDHARVEDLLGRATAAPPDDLPALLAAVRTELAAHFSREEELLRVNAFPGLHCHVAQHATILADLGRMTKAPAAQLPRLLAVVIPQLVQSHIVTMDGMAAAFLKGEIDESDFDGLRLPVPESAA